MNQITEHMDVVGADGTMIGKVDRLDGKRIKLTKASSPGGHKDHHHFIDLKLVASVEGNTVKLSKNADAAIAAEQEA